MVAKKSSLKSYFKAASYMAIIINLSWFRLLLFYRGDGVRLF